jgi:hypothetical protein
MIKMFSELKEGDRFSETDSPPQFEVIGHTPCGRVKVINLRDSNPRYPHWVVSFPSNKSVFVQD